MSTLSQPLGRFKYNECAGEDVAFSGTFHIVVREADQHLMVHLKPVGVTGVGQTSGTTYQFVGAPTNITIYETDTGVVYTQVNNPVLASQGSPATASRGPTHVLRSEMRGLTDAYMSPISKRGPARWEYATTADRKQCSKPYG